jgi:hypothetical protein
MLIHLIIVLGVIAILWICVRWLLPYLGLPAPITQIVMVILVVITIVALLMILLPFLGVGTGTTGHLAL